MARTLVNLVSEQTTPNFLFIKEMMQVGDELLFITSKKFETRIQWIINALNCEKGTILDPIILPEGAEEKWTAMVDAIKKELSKDSQYIVNLTCGTKYMISAAPKAFEGFNAAFYYIPFPKNVILKIGNEESKAITYRMSVKEYFDCNNTQIPNQKELTQSEEYTKTFFEKFLKSELDFTIVDLLRSYRDYKKDTIKKCSINEVETMKEGNKKKPQIQGLRTFLLNIDIKRNEQDYLSNEECQYLTGGWFEEYIYSLIADKVSPQDILLGVDLPITDNKQVSRRDLDIVFTYENKLFIIECKTGIDGEKMLVETVYKAAALKNERLGKLSASTSIFSLSGENEKFKDIAKAMNIAFYDKSYFSDEKKFEIIISNINKKAKG